MHAGSEFEIRPLAPAILICSLSSSEVLDIKPEFNPLWFFFTLDKILANLKIFQNLELRMTIKNRINSFESS